MCPHPSLAYAPLDHRSDLHRTLYLSFCKECGSPESWTCWRAIHKPPIKAKKKKGKPKTPQPQANGKKMETEWNVTSFAVPTTTTDDLEELLRLRDLSLAPKVSSGQPKSKKKKKAAPIAPIAVPEQEPVIPGELQGVLPGDEAAQPSARPLMEKVAPAVWLSIEQEPEAMQATKEVLVAAPTGEDPEDAGSWSGEQYEPNKAYTKQLSRFLKTVQRAPEQVLRYKFQGEPLWVTSFQKEMPEVSLCGLCGSARVFELQLMPQGLNWVIEHLVTSMAAKLRLIGIGSVLLFTCPSSCDSVAFTQELCFAQDTEDNVGNFAQTNHSSKRPSQPPIPSDGP